MTNTASDDDVFDSPIYWFALMEFGRDHGHFEQAAQAKAELERLGVRVIYRPRGRVIPGPGASDSLRVSDYLDK